MTQSSSYGRHKTTEKQDDTLPHRKVYDEKSRDSWDITRRDFSSFTEHLSMETTPSTSAKFYKYHFYFVKNYNGNATSGIMRSDFFMKSEFISGNLFLSNQQNPVNDQFKGQAVFQVQGQVKGQAAGQVRVQYCCSPLGGAGQPGALCEPLAAAVDQPLEDIETLPEGGEEGVVAEDAQRGQRAVAVPAGCSACVPPLLRGAAGVRLRPQGSRLPSRGRSR